MCGITGICYHTTEQHVDAHKLQQMCDVLYHRGPDEEGIHIAHNVGLGMRRLKIIDLETGSQPIYNEDGSIVVVFNGEIYNYRELRETLLKQGHQFKTQTDTEVLVHLYEQHGDAFLTHLNGMFAIALWDARRQRLLLARDRMGEKPLYYACNQHGLLFASELKSLVASGEIKREMDCEAVYHYFSYGYIPAPLTIYRNVHKLQPAHFLVYERGQAHVQPYWELDYTPDYQRSEADFVEDLRALMKDAVQLRLVSDVPLGAFLSGGVDSTLIVGLMSQLMTQPVKTFSIGFDEQGHNELEFARIVAKQFGTEHQEFVVKPSAIELVDKLAWHFDEPFADSSAIPMYLVSKMTREHATVALSGDGGDELFVGYERYKRILKRHKWLGAIPKPMRMLGASIGHRLPRRARGKAFLQSLALDEFRFFCVGLSDSDNQSLFSRDFLNAIQPIDSLSVANPYRLENAEFLSQFSFVDTMLYLPDDILVKVDRMSMAVSLEARPPFLDHRVVELLGQMPAALKYRNGVSKYLLKVAFRDLLPHTIVNRSKHGFTLPVDLWFRGELRSLAEDLFAPARLNRSGIFNSDYLQLLLQEHLSGQKNHKTQLWSLLMFLLWYDSEKSR